jgi:Protein of unknown function (DUF3710)
VTVVRFGRKKQAADETPAETPADEVVEETADAPALAAVGGPHDVSDVEYDENDPTRVNLGSLIVTGRPGIELRLQVDEATGAVGAALLVTQEGAVELRAFASPRGGGIWDDVRRSIRAEAARQGGTATETDGPWGTELQLVVTGKDEAGATVTQATRIAGITGPRWLLRATFFGKPAAHPDPDDPLEQAVRDVIVVRGSQAMAPGDFLPLTLPAGAQRHG